MPKYNEFLYNSGALYGDSSKLVFNAEPMVATAIDYSSVTITYITPSGGTDGYVGFRIVRSQDGYPETEEDGVTIYEVLGLDANPDGNPIIDNNDLWIPTEGLADGATAPTLQEGQFVYYKAWVLKTPTDTWIPAGQCYTLVPKRHTLALGGSGVKSVLLGSTMVDQPISLGEASTTHDRFMSYIPQVYTSISNSPLDEINSVGYLEAQGTGAEGNTLLSSFLSAFSFTIDEMMTFAANSLPAKSGQITSPELLSIQSEQFNIAQDSLLVSKTQKRLVRDSIKTYAKKGTLKGFQTFVENTTNYSAVITESRNKILGHENSTFDAKGWDYGSDSYGYAVVDWQADSTTAQLSLDEAQTIPSVASAIDKNYCLKITTTDTNAAISYGSNSPILHGIPVVSGVQYVLSFQAKRQLSPSISGTATVAVKWYDSKEQILATAAGDAPSSSVATITASFNRFDFSWVAPAGARYASIQITFSSAQTYYLDMVMFNEAIYSEVSGASGTGTLVTYQGSNSFAVGDVVSIRGVVPSSYNLSNVTVVSVSSSSTGKQTGFTVSNAAIGTFISGGMASKIEAAPSYSEARSVRVFLNPSNTNYMVNPSFEGSASGWTASNCTTSAISTGSGALYSCPIGARTSAYKLRITPTGSSAIDFHTTVGSSVPGDILPQSVNYTFSTYIRSSATSPVTLANGLTFESNTNLISNSSFETDTVGWHGNHATSVRRIGGGVDGSYMLALTTDGTDIDGVFYYNDANTHVTPGQSYTFSIYVSQDSGNYSSQDFQAHIEWYDANGLISTSNGAVTTPDFVDTGFTKLSVTAVAPDGATGAIPTVYSTTQTHAADIFYFDDAVFTCKYFKDLVLTSDWQRVSFTVWAGQSSTPTSLEIHITGALPTGAYLEIDAAQLEVGVKPTDYFDGSMVDSGCAWVIGSANSTTSRSVKYANQSYRVARLLDTIKDFLPINTPWVLDYYDNALSDHLYSGIS